MRMLGFTRNNDTTPEMNLRHHLTLTGPMGASMQHSNAIIGGTASYDGMLLVAGFSGLAGVMSCLRRARADNESREDKFKVTVVWSVRHVKHLYAFWDELVQELHNVQGDTPDHQFPVMGWLMVYVHITGALGTVDKAELHELVAESKASTIGAKRIKLFPKSGSSPTFEANPASTTRKDEVNMSALMRQAIWPGRCDYKIFRNRIMDLARSSAAGEDPKVNVYYCGAKPMLDEINKAVKSLPHQITMNSNDIVHAEGFA
jgi:hypothetical protein